MALVDGRDKHQIYDDDQPIQSGRDLSAAEEKNIGVTGGGQGKDTSPSDLKKQEGGKKEKPKFDPLNGGFYKPGDREGPGDHTKFMKQKVGGKKDAGGFLNRHKKTLMFAGAGAGGVFLFFGVVIIMVLLIAPYKNVHFATILRSIGMARFTYVMDRQFSRTIFDASVLTSNSTGRFQPPQSSLFYKLVGINPQKQLAQLGNDDVLKFDFKGANRGWGGVLGRTNSFQGVVVDGKGYYLDDYANKLFQKDNYDDLSRSQARKVRSAFAQDVKANLTEALQLNNRRFRWGVYKGFYQATGIRLVKWFNKGKDYNNLNDEQARAKNATDTVEQVEGGEQAPKTGNSDIDENREKQRQADIDAYVRNTTPGEVRSKLAGRIRGVRSASAAVTIITLVCVLHSLNNSIDSAGREQQVARMGAETQTSADQTKTGDTTQQAVGAENAFWDGRGGTEDAQSAALFKQATGQPLSTADQAQMAAIPSVLPPGVQFKDAVALADQVLTGSVLTGVIPGLGKVHDSIVNVGCDALLNEYVQDGEALAEITIAVITAGTEEGVAQAIRAAVEGAVQFGASVGIGELIGSLIDSLIHDENSFSGLATGADRYNQNAVAEDYTQQVGNRQMTFGAPMNAQEAADGNIVAYADLRDKNSQSPFSERYFAIDNPYSLLGNVVGMVPSSFSGMASSIQSGLTSVMSVIGSPQRLIGSLAGIFTARNHAFAAATVMRPDSYGIDNWGWTLDELNRIDDDPSFDVASNDAAHPGLIETIEPNLDTLNKKYGPCYDPAYILQTQKPTDADCSEGTLRSDEALHWRVYMAESYDTAHLTGAL